MRIKSVLVVLCLLKEGIGSSHVVEKTAPSRTIEILPPLVMASVMTAALTYPLDFGRAMAMSSAVSGQAVRTISFTKGLGPELGKGTISRVIKFGVYPVVHSALQKNEFWQQRPTACRCAAGAIATIPEIALITPLEVTKLALQLDGVGAQKFQNSATRATQHLLKAGGGPGALYACHFGLQARQAVWTAVYFGSLPLLLQQTNSLFLAGLTAGALGALINNPIDVSRSVAQKDLIALWASGAPKTTSHFVPYLGRTLDAGRRVVSARGVQALWSGAAFKAAHLGFGGALMAVLQPACSRVWKTAPIFKKKPPTTETVTSLRGGGYWLAGYHPFGYKVTQVGNDFLEKIHGFADTDLGRLLASLKLARKRSSAIRSEWLELLRFSKTAQATRIFNQLDELLALALKAGLID